MSDELEAPPAYEKDVLMLFLGSGDAGRRKFLREHLQVTHHKISALFTWERRRTRVVEEILDRELDATERALATSYKQLASAAGLDSDIIVAEVSEHLRVSKDRVSACLGYSSVKKKINYDNPEKRLWRKEKRAYLDAAIPSKDRANSDVILLPAEEWLDVGEVYEPLGFKNQRLWGAEFDRELQPRFCERAKQLGSQFFAGDIRDLMKSSQRRYRVADLDFKGQLGRETLEEILPYLLLEDEASVLINFQRKREPRGVQKELRHAMHLSDRFLDADLPDFASYFDMLAQVSEEEPNASVKLSDLYENGTARLLQANMGRLREEDLLLRPEIAKIMSVCPQDFKELKQHHKWRLCITATLLEAGERLDEFFRETKQFDPFEHYKHAHQFLQTMVGDALEGRTRLTEVKTYPYLSPEGHTPFLTFACKFHRPRGEYLKMLNTCRFFTHVCHDHFANEDKPIGTFELQNEHGSRVRSLEDFSLRAKIAYMREGRQIVSLRWLDYHQELDKYISVRKGDFDFKELQKEMGVLAT